MTKLRSVNYSILILHVSLILAAMVHAQDNDQSGFISIDCGISEGSEYTDEKTGINYVSDAGFIDTGVSKKISPEYNLDNLDRQLTTLTSFPENIRNCYTLTPKQGKNKRYLIRLRFLHGKYDSEDQSPLFDLYLGADLWRSFNGQKPPVAYFLELIHVATSDYVNMCLVNTGGGIPFVSAIELRLLDFALNQAQSTSLDTLSRVYFDSDALTRYGDDKYDRLWYAISKPECRVIKASATISSETLGVPSKVMALPLHQQTLRIL